VKVNGTFGGTSSEATDINESGEVSGVGPNGFVPPSGS